MPRITCPECDEVVKVPDGGQARRCPTCGHRIGTDPPEEAPEAGAERKARPPRRRNARKEDPLRGVTALTIVGPIGALIACGAPFFSPAGTHLVIWAGVAIGLLGWIQVRRMYGSVEGNDFEAAAAGLAALIDSFYRVFKRPRLLAAYMSLMVMGLAMFGEGVVLIVAFKTLREKPADPAPDPGGEQRPAAPNPPNQPPPPPDPSAVADKAITDALVNLDGPDDRGRADAAGALSRMPPKDDRRAEVVTKLNDLANDPNPSVRVDAVKALGVWGGPDVVPTLIGALDHEDGLTRRAAAVAIRRFRDERAVPVLVKRLPDTQCTGECAAALVAIGPVVERSVIPLLASKDAFTQAPAIGVLKAVGTVDCVAALQKIAATKLYPAGLAQEALKAISARGKKK